MLLQVVAEIAKALLSGQACAALEGVQRAQHLVDGADIITLFFPTPDRRLHRFEQVIAFFQEDIKDIAVSLFGFIALDHRPEVDCRRHAQLLVRVGTKALDRLDQGMALRHRALTTHGFEHLGQTVVAGLQQGKQLLTGSQATATEPLVKEFQLMRQVADFTNLGHARTTLEGVQVTLQGFQLQTVVDVAHPALQSSTGTVDDVETFLEEDFHQFGIALFMPVSQRALWLWL